MYLSRITAPQPPQRLDGLRPIHAGHWFGGFEGCLGVGPLHCFVWARGRRRQGFFKFPNQGSLQLNVRGAGTLLFTNMCISYLGYLGTLEFWFGLGKLEEEEEEDYTSFQPSRADAMNRRCPH